jgi:PhnB protein
MTVKATLTPYLCAKDASAAIEFYKRAFEAIEVYRIAEPNGRIGHVELKIGDTLFYLSDEYPELGVLSPQSLNGTPISLHLQIEDTATADRFFSQALAVGAKEIEPMHNNNFGERRAKVQDPFGHIWFLSTTVEEVSPDEMNRRFAAMLSENP